MIRILDIIISILGLSIGAPILILITIISYFDTGAPLFVQIRVGRNKMPFKLLKLRSMPVGAPEVATHLLDRKVITKFGNFLRRTRMDEVPQFWNVLKGDMSLVGPRPCLFNQTELIIEREKFNIFKVPPGLTGLAQIQGVDMTDPQSLVELEVQMLETMSIKKYLYYLALTVKVI